mmetsp:Transcript_19998/g.27980  ORF Transcript_19998/g.27980 Transcript_19998/m.27980 type:complete len:141 (-) Transcript_19998:151-573(-)
MAQEHKVKFQDIPSKEFATGNNWTVVPSVDDPSVEWVDHPSFPNSKICVITKCDTGARMLAKYAVGTTEEAHSHTAPIEWFLVKGHAVLHNPETGKSFDLYPGGYWYCPGKSPHKITVDQETIFYATVLGPPDFLAYHKH